MNYTNYHSKVVITCVTHGNFEQTPASHLKPEMWMKTSEKLSITKEQFIENVRKVHGNNY